MAELQDLCEIWTLNADQLKPVEACIHHLILERTKEQPDAPAICAWDGNLTYRQMDEMAARFAMYLAGRGVGPQVILPLCFQKSMWTAVATLAVMKAGAPQWFSMLRFQRRDYEVLSSRRAHSSSYALP